MEFVPTKSGRYEKKATLNSKLKEGLDGLKGVA